MEHGTLKWSTRVEKQLNEYSEIEKKSFELCYSL